MTLLFGKAHDDIIQQKWIKYFYWLQILSVCKFLQINLHAFSDTSRVEFQLNTYTTKEEIQKAINRIPYVYGGTHTSHALRRVRTEMFTSRNGDRHGKLIVQY